MNVQKTKEWCIEKRSFSLKLRGGYYDPSGDFIKVPSCIARYRRSSSEGAGGWVVTVTTDEGRSKKRFPDNNYGGCHRLALKEAVEWLEENKETLYITGRKIHCNEKPTKQNKLGFPGISYKITSLKNGRSKLTFLVRCGRTYQQHFVGGYDVEAGSKAFNEQLEKAVSIRAGFLEKYRSENGFKK